MDACLLTDGELDDFRQDLQAIIDLKVPSLCDNAQGRTIFVNVDVTVQSIKFLTRRHLLHVWLVIVVVIVMCA